MSTKILEVLEKIAPIIPINFYWLDTNHRVLGANEKVLSEIGATSLPEVVGKTLYEFHPQEIAENIAKHNNEVIKSGKNMYQDEYIKDLTTGEPKFFTAYKGPMKDDDGNIIGTITASLDITDKKEAERLRLENLELKIKAQNELLEAQEEFRKLVGQMIHDIQSPLASMRMLMYHASGIPEKDRLLLRSITDRISDITQDMLSHYKPKQDTEISKQEKTENLLLSATLEELINEKRYEYKNLDIKFELQAEHTSATDFVFIKIGIGSFKRMMSNLINNAVEALVNKSGIITINYEVVDEKVKINILDNGIGIPDNILTKLQNRVAVTYNKQNGHGIGLAQVWETITANNGKFNISSATGNSSGTTINIELAKVSAPKWIIDKINLTENDIVVILDDDDSIHGAWDIKLSEVITNNPTIKVVHFTDGIELIHYVNALDPLEKDKVYLLSDYELLKQRVTGLDVIRISQIKRAVLVTSHYINSMIIDNTLEQGIKILPKNLVQSIEVKLS